MSLRGGSAHKDPKGGCFCQAREHLLSKYVPICMQCGLVLCLLNAPFYVCPHCASPLTNASSRDALFERLSQELSEVVTKEAEQREHERLELQKAAGAFPTLGASSENLPVAPQPRKVLSLNQHTRKITVASYIPAPSPRPPSTSEVKEEVEIRVPPPLKEVDYVRGKSADGRRWQNIKGGSMIYVPLPAQSSVEGSRSGRRRKKKGPESNST
ncbi:hypothetical protein K439DRAFT_1395814 [Ramaria rubella]|nr:hypothetical protein K439DRAFT_1395814 [Ramaria rubella]